MIWHIIFIISTTKPAKFFQQTVRASNRSLTHQQKNCRLQLIVNKTERVSKMITSQPALKFQPRCMATTLSTVPFRDPHLACRTMLAHFPEAPCVPKLSLSLRRYIDGMPCLVIDPEKRRITYDLSIKNQLQTFYERYIAEDLEYFAINAKYAPGFYTFLKTLKLAPPADLKMIHIGLPGPLT